MKKLLELDRELAQGYGAYARYNQSPQGIRVLNHRKVYLFRRTPVLYAPVDPDIRPMRG